jgi:transposase
MEQCVGVDVSKQQLDWAIGGSGPVTRGPNTRAGIRRLVARLQGVYAALITVESTGATTEPWSMHSRSPSFRSSSSTRGE